jgi:hypothetical protein
MKRKVMTAAARRRAQRRELRKEIARLLKLAEEGLALLDEPMPGADQGVILEARIIGDKIVTEAETD